MTRATEILGEFFGYSEFRGGQRAAIESVTNGRDTVVLLPTGAGKSVCYQVPGLLESRSGGGTTIVISPLIALMQDQVDGLRSRGIAAAALHSHLTDFDRAEVARVFSRGELDFLYCSPERAALPSFQRLLGSTRIALVAIDEAHCMSQWGHDFRPEYMRLSELVELAAAPTVALTATATPQVIEEVVVRLGLREPTIVRGDFSRPNLAFSVEHHRGDAARLQSLLTVLDAAGMRGPARGDGRAIVYCSTRKKTETVAKELISAGYKANHYHAGRTALARERAKRAFDTSKIRILVATNAFGMGIDYPDVRVIVHFQAPGSVAAYYQEAGRAGRDGRPARCVLFFGPADMATQRRLASSNATSSRGGPDPLAAMEDYARGTMCRQRFISSHFTGEDTASRCECCDVCCTPSAVSQPAPAHRDDVIEPLSKADRGIIRAAVSRLRRPAGKGNLAKALRGSKAKTLSRGGLKSLPEYGALKAYSEASVVAAIDDLLSRGVLEMRGTKYPKVWLKGRPVREPRDRTQPSETRTSKPRKPSAQRRHHTPITKALDNYRRRRARALNWKPYMVFQKRSIVAIDQQRPESLDALFKIPGLGPAKVERFGEDILALVRDFR